MLLERAMGEPIAQPCLANTGLADEHDLRRSIRDAQLPGLTEQTIGVEVPEVDDLIVFLSFVGPGRGQQRLARVERKT